MARKKVTPGSVEAKAAEPVMEPVVPVAAEVAPPVDAAAEPPKKLYREHQFKPGNKMSPGRPKGTRNKLTKGFIAAMCHDFELHGIDVVESVRRDKPEAYLKVIASLVPQQVEVGEAGAFSELSDDELDGYIGEKTAQLAALEADSARFEALH